MHLENHLTIHIQPIFDTNTLKVNYSEVLVRPIDKTKNVADILEEVKENKAYTEFDCYVLSESCRFIREKPNLSAILLVNLCKETIETQGVSSHLINIVNESKVDRKKIILEINEYTEFSSINTIKNIDELIENGLDVAIDDFGIGNTTLKAVRSTRAKVVKFDKTMLDISNISSIKRLFKMVSDFHSLNIDTVIEGVETEEQLKLAQKIGYNNIQGYLFEKPISVDDYISKYINIEK